MGYKIKQTCARMPLGKGDNNELQSDGVGSLVGGMVVLYITNTELWLPAAQVCVLPPQHTAPGVKQILSSLNSSLTADSHFIFIKCSGPTRPSTQSMFDG